MIMQTFIRVSGVVLLMAAVSLAVLAVTCILQNVNRLLTPATIRWNG